MARMLRLSHDELYEFVKLYDTLRDMDFELTEHQTNVFDRVQSMETTYDKDSAISFTTDDNKKMVWNPTGGGDGQGQWEGNDDYGSKVDALVDSMEVSE
tara:strand:- start:1 stop:297 length:297 start_codon:yes stop_codon:yes gene_type:complete